MNQDQKKYVCAICGDKFQMSNGIYDGEYISRYQIQVCRICYSSNYDGWGPAADEILVSHIKAKGLPIPARNAKGWLPRA